MCGVCSLNRSILKNRSEKSTWSGITDITDSSLTAVIVSRKVLKYFVCCNGKFTKKKNDLTEQPIPGMKKPDRTQN